MRLVLFLSGLSLAVAGLAADCLAAPISDGRCPPNTVAVGDAPAAMPRSQLASAKPNQCVLQRIIPAVTKTYTEDEVVTPARHETRTIPAIKTKKLVNVLITPGHKETVHVAAVVHDVTDDVIVKPAQTLEEDVPAVYRTETLKVLIVPETSHWVTTRRSDDPALLPPPPPSQITVAGTTYDTSNTSKAQPRADSGTNFVYQLETVPAQYEIRETRVLVTPATKRKVLIPAVIEKRVRQVIDVPAHDVVNDIPAMYRTEEQEVVVSPERIQTIETPAVIRKVNKTRIVTPEAVQWILIDAIAEQPEVLPPSTMTVASMKPDIVPTSSKLASVEPGSPSPRLNLINSSRETKSADASSAIRSLPNAPDVASGRNIYKLGAGDKVRVIVFGEPDLTGEFSVSGDGVVSIPLAGDLRAAGLTATELQTEIAQALMPKYLQDARVNVEVQSFRPFYILGEVNKPGEYPFSNGITIAKAVAIASGYTYRGNSKKYYLKREGQEKETLINSSDDVMIGPGDLVRIPERHF